MDALNLMDKLELKAVNDGSVSYAALERKAELYDKLVRGELPDEEETEKYCVDFFGKSLTQDGSEQREGNNSPPETSAQGEDDGNEAMLFNAKPAGPGRTGIFINNDEHKQFVREVHEEANEAREKATEIKMRRQAQVAANREKLRKAYLRKQLEKLKAAKALESSAEQEN
ncbi:hypothetical protein ACLOJK_008447 [Asimina triloba]